MKTRLLIILFLALSLSFNLYAQNIKYGLVAGIAYPSLSIRNVNDDRCEIETSAISAFHINGFVSFKSNSWWEISLEPGYNQKGGRVNFTFRHESGLINNIKANKKYDTVELPILLNSYISSKFYLSSGINLILYTDTDYDQNWQSSNPMGNSVYTISTRNLLPNYEKRLNCSGVFGLSYQLTDVLDLSVRYQLGFTKIMQIDLLNAFVVNTNLPKAYCSVYCNSFQLSLKYKIN